MVTLMGVEGSHPTVFSQNSSLHQSQPYCRWRNQGLERWPMQEGLASLEWVGHCGLDPAGRYWLEGGTDRSGRPVSLRVTIGNPFLLLLGPQCSFL